MSRRRAVRGGLHGRPLSTDERDLVRERRARHRVVVEDELSLAPERAAEISARSAERLRVPAVREHDHEHVLDRRRPLAPPRWCRSRSRSATWSGRPTPARLAAPRPLPPLAARRRRRCPIRRPGRPRSAPHRGVVDGWSMPTTISGALASVATLAPPTSDPTITPNPSMNITAAAAARGPGIANPNAGAGVACPRATRRAASPGADPAPVPARGSRRSAPRSPPAEVRAGRRIDAVALVVGQPRIASAHRTALRGSVAVGSAVLIAGPSVSPPSTLEVVNILSPQLALLKIRSTPVFRSRHVHNSDGAGAGYWAGDRWACP